MGEWQCLHIIHPNVTNQQSVKFNIFFEATEGEQVPY
jgi:hypothetical protein